MRVGPATAALIVGALLALTGCGGGKSGSGVSTTRDAATLVPPGATTFLRVRTSELARATALLGLLPARGRVLRMLPRVPTGVGPELDVATVAGARISYTQPADPQAFAKRLDGAGLVHASIGGWMVYAASTTLLDAIEQRRGSLADRSWFATASARLPAGAALRELTAGWRAAALTVRDGEAELDVHRLRPAGSRSPGEAPSTLAAAVPADATFAAGVAGPANVPAGAPALLHRLAVALGGPAVLWVRPGGDLPEVTVVARPAEPRRALGATARLVARLTKNPTTAPVTVDGVRLRQVTNGAVDLDYGLVGGRLVVGDSADAAARAATGALGGSGPAVLSSLPGVTEWWGYADAASGLPLLRAFSGLFDASVTARLETRLAPFRGLLVFAGHDGQVETTVTRVDLRKPHP